MIQILRRCMSKNGCILILCLFPITVFAQTGPGGVGIADGTSNLSLWLDATKISGINDGAVISSWEDQSGNEYDATVVVDEGMGAVGPVYSLNGGGTNNRAAITFDESQKHYLKVIGNSEILPTEEISVFCVGNFEDSSDDWAGMLFTSDDDDWDDGWAIAEEIIGSGMNETGGSFAAWVDNYQDPGCNLNIADDYGTDHIWGIVYSANDFSAYKSETTCSDASFSGPINYDSGGMNSNDDLLIGKAMEPVYLTGDIEEIIIYDRALSDAERIIVSNYLEAKYGMALTANDVYDEDDNEGYYYDVAGIGQAADGSNHIDAKGTGWIRMHTPSDLDNSEFLMWGHDNADLNHNPTNVPSGTDNRVNRQWSVSEYSGSSVGTVTLSFDCSSLSITNSTHLQLLINTDQDFSNAIAYTSGISYDNVTNVVTFTGVDFSDNDHFTLGSSSSENLLGEVAPPLPDSQTGPGGIGTTDGLGSLMMWQNSSSIDQDDNTEVNTWNDQSGYGHNLSQNDTGSDEGPNYLENQINGYPILEFDASNEEYLGMEDTETMKPNMISIFLVGNMKQTSDSYGGFLLKEHDGDWNDGYGITRRYKKDEVTGWVTKYNENYVNSDLTYGVNSIVSMVYDKSSVEVFNNETSDGTDNYTDDILHDGGDFDIGWTEGFLDGGIAEVIMYNTAVNDAQRIILHNYLAAKFGLTISNDFYDEDESTDNFDHDVSGIGQAADGSNHTDAQGSGWVRMHTPSDLDNGEFLIWGHDKGTLSQNITDVPSGTDSRINRQWSVSENGGDGLGTVSVSFDCSNLIIGDENDLQLLIDGDNTFASASIHVEGLSYNSTSKIVTFTSVDFSDNDHFTLGSSSSQNALGGLYYLIGSGSWEDNSNWSTQEEGGESCSCYPMDEDHSVVIYKDAALTIESDKTIKSLIIEEGGSLTCLNNNVDISLKGSWLNNGEFNSLNGSVDFSGNKSQSIGGDSITTFANLTINNTSGGVALTSDQKLTGTLTLSSGQFTTTGNDFTIVSNSSGTGRIAEIGSGASITGNITMQRYFPLATDESGTAWREFTSCIQGADLNDWQDDFLTCGFPGASSQVCGGFVSAYYYDESLDGGVSANGWQAVSSASQNTNGLGVSVYVSEEDFTLDVTGPPITGTQVYNTSTTPKLSFTDNYAPNDQEDGWNLLGNPFPCSINWNKVDVSDKVGIDNVIYTYNNEAGNYGAYTADLPIGTNMVDSIIPSGQAFWVHANAANPSLTIREEDKDLTDKAIIKSNMIINGFLKLSIDGSENNFRDELVLMFDDEGTLDFDVGKDALKWDSFNTSAPSISSVTLDGRNLSIDYLPNKISGLTIPIRTKVGVSGNYNINVEELGILADEVELILIDSLNGETTNLMLINTYSFAISDTTSIPRMFLRVNLLGLPVFVKDNHKSLVELYPNPNNGAFTILHVNNDFNLMIIRDTGGRVIQKKRIKSKSSVKARINNAGVYFVTLSNKTNSVVRKVVVR